MHTSNMTKVTWLSITLLVLMVFITVEVNGQINFSPGWGQGKRSLSDDKDKAVNGCSDCSETMIEVYRLLKRLDDRLATTRG